MNQLHVTTDASSDRRNSNLHPSATKHGTKAMRRFWMEAKTGCRVVWKRCSSCLRIGLAHRSAPLGQGRLGQARPVWGNLFGNAAISSFATFRTRASCLSLRLSGREEIRHFACSASRPACLFASYRVNGARYGREFLHAPQDHGPTDSARLT